MKRKLSRTVCFFLAVMLAFSLVMAVFTVLRARVNFQLDDLARSLETSRGRERKQQYEYDEVTASLPQVQAELEETQPLAREAAEEVSRLKEERKRLRAEKKKLEEARAAEAQKQAEGSGKGGAED